MPKQKQNRGNREPRKRAQPLTPPIDHTDEWQMPSEMPAITRDKYCSEFAEGYKPFASWTLQEQLKKEMARLSKGIGVCEAVSHFPRRIDNSDQAERRMDRKRGNSFSFTLRQVAGLWTVAYDATPEVKPIAKYRRAAAQVNWPEWWADWHADLIQRRGKIAATCLTYSMESIGNKVSHLLTREMGMMEDAAIRMDIEGQD